MATCQEEVNWCSSDVSEDSVLSDPETATQEECDDPYVFGR